MSIHPGLELQVLVADLVVLQSDAVDGGLVACGFGREAPGLAFFEVVDSDELSGDDCSEGVGDCVGVVVEDHSLGVELLHRSTLAQFQVEPF